MTGSSIGNAPSGQNSAPVGTEKVPLSGSKYALLTTIWQYCFNYIATLTAKTTLTGADIIPLNDSAASNVGKGITFTNLLSSISKNTIKYIAFPLNGTTVLTTSEKCYQRIPVGYTGMDLISVTGSVGTGAAGSSSSGTPTFTVKNVTDNVQMLSTSLTIDANEYTSATAATAAVIDTTKDDVVTDDLIEVAVTTSGTGVTYATVTLGFRLP